MKRTDGASVRQTESVSTHLRQLWISVSTACNEQATLWDETRRLVNPHEVYVDLSDRLYKMKTDLLNKMHPGRIRRERTVMYIFPAFPHTSHMLQK